MQQLDLFFPPPLLPQDEVQDAPRLTEEMFGVDLTADLAETEGGA